MPNSVELTGSDRGLQRSSFNGVQAKAHAQSAF